MGFKVHHTIPTTKGNKNVWRRVAHAVQEGGSQGSPAQRVQWKYRQSSLLRSRHVGLPFRQFDQHECFAWAKDATVLSVVWSAEARGQFGIEQDCPRLQLDRWGIGRIPHFPPLDLQGPGGGVDNPINGDGLTKIQLNTSRATGSQ